MTMRALPLLLLLGFPAFAATPTLDADFPAANARVLSHDGDSYTLAPDLRDTTGWWFHFHFRLRGSPGDAATIRFLDNNPVGVRGPAISSDGGRTWNWAGAEVVTASKIDGHAAWSFRAVLPDGVSEVRYAFAPTYLQSHLDAWIGEHRKDAALKVEELCKSRKGRPVTLLHVGAGADGSKPVILLTSRHHACESMATYAMEGLLSAALADDDLGRGLRERYEILAVPFMDTDGVEDGDQGKNRAPHDHNRDYNEKPLYPEVAAWMKLTEPLKPRVAFTLDMHCPHIRGAWNDRVYLVGSAPEAVAERQRAFLAVLERTHEGPIPIRAKDCYLPANTGWNTNANYAAGRSNGQWCRDTFTNARFTGGIEIAYADALGVEMNAGSARALGRDLARAIGEFLRP
jgi:hypothetical protein